MPPQPLPKKTLSRLRRRFRELVDWAFDGNLSLASRVLEMPFSTVQRYYQSGPRRIDARAFKRVEELFGLGPWIIAEEEPRMPDKLAMRPGWHLVTSDDKKGPSYWIPEVVMWRVRLILKAMADLTGRDEESLIPVLFAPIFEGIKVGLVKAPPAVLSGDLGEPRGFAAVLNRDTARKVHKLGEYWERELGIEV